MPTHSPAQSVAAARAELLAQLLPDGPPLLWCPPLTHYAEDGTINTPRMQAHFRHLAPSVRGFLVPGSTGDGWELNEEERRTVLEIAVESAPALNARLLLGVLQPRIPEAIEVIKQDLRWLKTRTKEHDGQKAMV